MSGTSAAASLSPSTGDLSIETTNAIIAELKNIFPRAIILPIPGKRNKIRLLAQGYSGEEGLIELTFGNGDMIISDHNSVVLSPNGGGLFEPMSKETKNLLESVKPKLLMIVKNAKLSRRNRRRKSRKNRKTRRSH
jgi:hypothetical protein